MLKHGSPSPDPIARREPTWLRQKGPVPLQPQSEDRIRKVAVACAAMLIVCSLCIWAGWQFRIPLLKGEMFGTFVAPNTALLLFCVALSAIAQWTRVRPFNVIGVSLGLFVVLFSGAMLVEHISGLDLGIDGVFMRHRLSDWTVTSPPGRVAAPTVTALAFVGIGLMSFSRRSRNNWSDIAGAVVASLAYLALIGYLFNASFLYGRIMALPTAIMLCVSAILLFTGSRKTWLIPILLSGEAGGILVRRFGLAVLLLTPLMGLVAVRLVEWKVVTLEHGSAFFVVAVVMLFAAILLHTALLLNAIDADRLRSQAALVRTEKLNMASRLVASVAHEVNNPLEAVTNLIYIARTKDLPAETDKFLGMADEELRRIAHITRQTLGFYRGESSPANVSAMQLVSGVLSLHQRRAAARTTSFQVVGNDASLFVDSGEARQVLSNLVANALDAVPNDGSGLIKIEIKSIGDFVELTVADNGAGLPEEYLKNVFEPFFTTKSQTGTGLGLFIAKQLVEKNGGSIRLTNDIARGGGGVATVRFRAAGQATENVANA